MRWFKRTTTPSKEPSTKQPDPDVQERQNIITLSEVNAKEVVEQMMRFLMPVYEHVVDSDKARFLLAYTKMRYPWSEFLPRFTSSFEAALALLDDRVSVLQYFCKNPDEKFIINDIEQFEKNMRETAHNFAKTHIPHLEDAVDFALAYITVNVGPVKYTPSNGKGMNHGMLLYKRHQERLSAMVDKYANP